MPTHPEDLSSWGLPSLGWMLWLLGGGQERRGPGVWGDVGGWGPQKIMVPAATLLPVAWCVWGQPVSGTGTLGAEGQSSGLGALARGWDAALPRSPAWTAALASPWGWSCFCWDLSGTPTPLHCCSCQAGAAWWPSVAQPFPLPAASALCLAGAEHFAHPLLRFLPSPWPPPWVGAGQGGLLLPTGRQAGLGSEWLELWW